MAKPFDSSVRVLIERYLPDWLALAPRKAQGPVCVIDSDLSTVTAEADKLIRVEEPKPWILHLEPQANWDGDLDKRVSWYNGIVEYKHDCLVHSVIVLLRREADSPRLTGEYIRQFPGESAYRYFRYQVIRVWQMSANDLASGSWGLFPLAPLCDDAQGHLPDLLERMATRLQNETTDRQELSMLWETTAILSDLRHDPKVFLPLMQKVMKMVKLEDLNSYDMMVGKGIRRAIIALGKKKFGPPDQTIVAALEAIEDVDHLESLNVRVLSVNSWEELLAGETTPDSR